MTHYTMKEHIIADRLIADDAYRAAMNGDVAKVKELLIARRLVLKKIIEGAQSLRECDALAVHRALETTGCLMPDYEFLALPIPDRLALIRAATRNAL